MPGPGLSSAATQPLVSVITLTFNRADLLSEAVASVQAQSYRHYEHIIIDDGSTDATEAMVQGIDDPRVRYIRHKENAGVALRRAQCLGFAQGEYIAILDSDDQWTDPHKLREQVAFMQAHPRCVLLGTNIRRVTTGGETVAFSDYPADDHTIRGRILGYNHFAHSSVMMRASALALTGGYALLDLAQDYDLYLQLGQHGEFAILPDVTTAYLQHDGQISRSRVKQVAEAVHSVRRHGRHYPNFWRGYLRLQRMLWALKLKRLLGLQGPGVR
jgi:glycosyltransferase involved in cell wall biosynthesis